jgi:hypothetical protein
MAAVLGKLPRARILIEASTESEWVARCLEDLGHEVIIADPNFAPMYATRSRRVKTDRRDAQALMDACRLGAYRPAHRTSEPQRRVRTLLAVRDNLVRTRVRQVQLLRALLRREGPRPRSGQVSSFAKRLDEAEPPSWLRDLIAPVRVVMDTLNREMVRVDQAIVDITRKDPIVERLCTAPGIGLVTAVAFVSTLDQVARVQRWQIMSPVADTVSGGRRCFLRMREPPPCLRWIPRWAAIRPGAESVRLRPVAPMRLAGPLMHRIARSPAAARAPRRREPHAAPAPLLRGRRVARARPSPRAGLAATARLYRTTTRRAAAAQRSSRIRPVAHAKAEHACRPPRSRASSRARGASGSASNSSRVSPRHLSLRIPPMTLVQPPTPLCPNPSVGRRRRPVTAGSISGRAPPSVHTTRLCPNCAPTVPVRVHCYPPSSAGRSGNSL